MTGPKIDFSVIDGDGHIQEEMDEIAARLTGPYKLPYERNRQRVLFPPFDHFHLGHFHGGPSEMRGGTRGWVGPKEWIEFLEELGIERTVLYPTAALSIGKIRDASYALALCRAYNDWIAETYLQASPRFSAMAIVPMQDPVAGATELRRAVNELGLSGGMLPAHGLPLHLGSSYYFPVYAAANELGCAIAVHGASHDGFGFDDLNVYAPVHALGHPFGQLISLAGFVFNGVFDRFPAMRVAFLEGGAAWILLALERFEESYETHIPYDLENGPKLEGREIAQYILDLIAQDQLFIGCEGGERDLRYVVDVVSDRPFIYASDFPHEVTTDSCRHEIDSLFDRGLSPESCRAILRENARRLYGLG